VRKRTNPKRKAPRVATRAARGVKKTARAAKPRRGRAAGGPLLAKERAIENIGAARVKPGPLKVTTTRWVTPTGKRRKKGDRPAKAGGFGALHRTLLDVPKLGGKLVTYAVTVRARDNRGRFVKIHEGKRQGIPALANARQLRAVVERRIRREVFNAGARHRRKYPQRPAVGASRAQFQRWKKAVTRYKDATGLQFKVEVFREVTTGAGGEGGKARVRLRRRRGR
jgi:hypothetical protein